MNKDFIDACRYTWDYIDVNKNTWDKIIYPYDINNLVPIAYNLNERKEEEMFFYSVTFDNGGKIYTYKSKMKLEEGEKYKISSVWKTYENPVTIKCRSSVLYGSMPVDQLVEIVKAERVYDKKIKNPISQVYFNEEKGTTAVKWYDGTTTKVSVQDGEPFDREKGIALCFMKRKYNNRGAYFNIIKEGIENAIDSNK